MFVQTNNIRAAKSYMQERLKHLFSASEIRHMMRESLCQRLKLTPTEYLLCDDHLLSESDLLFLRSIVKRLLQNEPFQYILGETHFCGITLKTDARALIPRPETEELVDWISTFYENKEGMHVLDVCSGSGCIAFALKDQHPSWVVKGLELSQDALSLSRENAKQLQLEVEFFEGDALHETTHERFMTEPLDCIVSNPPYIPQAERMTMYDNVLAHEPEMALFVPDHDPLLFYRQIGRMAMTCLKRGGTVFFELHENLNLETQELMENLGFVNIQLRKDLQGKNRMLLLQKP